MSDRDRLIQAIEEFLAATPAVICVTKDDQSIFNAARDTLRLRLFDVLSQEELAAGIRASASAIERERERERGNWRADERVTLTPAGWDEALGL